MRQAHWGTIQKFVLTCAVFTLALGGGTAWAAEGDFVWAKGMGGTNNDEGRSVAVDDLGNVYTAGQFRDAVDFDPGAGTFNLTSAGISDIFISKLDANGNFLWAKRMGGANSDVAFSIAVDSSRNVYTTGFFRDTVDFDPGVGIFNLTSSGTSLQTIFISKLDTNGNFVWAKSMGGASSGSGKAVAVDATGNVNTTGVFVGAVDFDPGSGTYNLTSSGSSDIFVSKLDTNGNFVWAKSMGGGGEDVSNSIALDSVGNVYTTGYFGLGGTTDFDPGPGTYNLTLVGGIQDIFVSKLDTNGDFVWAKGMGGSSTDEGKAIAVDSGGNAYITGRYFNTVDFDPGPATFIMTAPLNDPDYFVSKLDINGNFLWAASWGVPNNSIYITDVALDIGLNVYITGNFSGTIDFDPGLGNFNLVSTMETIEALNSNDAFITKLDTNGSFLWAQAMGGSGSETPQSIALNAGGIYATGHFSEVNDQGTSFGMTSVGFSDILVLKIQGIDTTDPTFTPITASPSFAEVGQTVTITFTASEPLQGNPTVTVNTNVATYSSMNGFTWQYTYTVSGADTLGAATIEITGQDTSGNIGISTNNTSLVLVMAGGVPLVAWPGIMALAAAGAIVLRRRKQA